MQLSIDTRPFLGAVVNLATETGNGGWVRVADLDSGGWAAIRFELDGSRLEPAELYTATPAFPEKLSMSRFTGAVNGPTLRKLVLESLDNKITLDEQLAAWKKRTDRRNRPREPDAVIDGHDAPGRKPDEFYQRVADIYSTVLAAGRYNPSAVIAKANGVSVGHVHNWIRTTRSRGFLPPAASTGRAG